MNNERTFIEKLLVVIAWTGLVGGIAAGIVLFYNEMFVVQEEMCFPQAFVYLFGCCGAAIVGFALIMELVSIADRLRELQK